MEFNKEALLKYIEQKELTRTLGLNEKEILNIDTDKQTVTLCIPRYLELISLEESCQFIKTSDLEKASKLLIKKHSKTFQVYPTEDDGGLLDYYWALYNKWRLSRSCQ